MTGEHPYGWKHWVLMGLALAALAAWGLRLWNLRPSDLLQKPVRKAPDFSFTDRSGRKVSNADVRGKVWVADFIFTGCAGTCPLLSGQLKRLQEEWKGNPGFGLVSFTVDPKRDTVEALRKYAANLQADEKQWFFLTGEKKDLFKAAQEGFQVTAKDDPQGAPGFEFIHTTRMALVDPRGMIRGYYDGQEEEDMKKLRKDVRFLMGAAGGR